MIFRRKKPVTLVFMINQNPIESLGYEFKYDNIRVDLKPVIWCRQGFDSSWYGG